MDDRRLSEAIVRLVKLAARLRGPGGCPWDAKQTDEAVKNYLLEEAYEVLDAIDRGDAHLVCAELGDLLFQIIFLAELASERGEFEFADVVEKIEEKMIRRHPHVFGEVEVKDAEEVARNWARIKKAEKGEKAQEGMRALREVPLSLPALIRCHRICERASKLNLEISRVESPLKLIEEGVKALQDLDEKGLTPEKQQTLGCALFAFVEAVRQRGGNAEDLLRKTNERFLLMAEALEMALKADGSSLETANSEQMKASWEKVKKEI